MAHETIAKMKDGRTYYGMLYEFRPEAGYLTIPQDETAPDKIYFRDMESCITKGQRTGLGVVEDQDEIARARENGWDGS